jgi:hypothetical protein
MASLGPPTPSPGAALPPQLTPHPVRGAAAALPPHTLAAAVALYDELRAVAPLDAAFVARHARALAPRTLAGGLVR